jgi:DNA-binding Xre family transcriptional regulator
MMPHLGRLIEWRLTAVGMSKAEFARRINCSRQNVTLIIGKKSMNTDHLAKICRVLDYDFFDAIERPRNEGIKEVPKRKVFVMAEIDAEKLPYSLIEVLGD